MNHSSPSKEAQNIPHASEMRGVDNIVVPTARDVVTMSNENNRICVSELRQCWRNEPTGRSCICADTTVGFDRMLRERGYDVDCTISPSNACKITW